MVKCLPEITEQVSDCEITIICDDGALSNAAHDLREEASLRTYFCGFQSKPNLSHAFIPHSFGYATMPVQVVRSRGTL